MVQRVDGSAVAFELLQEDAVVQAQRACDARAGIVALRGAQDVLEVCSSSTREVRWHRSAVSTCLSPWSGAVCQVWREPVGLRQ